LGKIVPGIAEQDMTENLNRMKPKLPRANDFTDFTVRTARYVCRAGKSITHMNRRRHRVIAGSL